MVDLPRDEAVSLFGVVSLQWDLLVVSAGVVIGYGTARWTGRR